MAKLDPVDADAERALAASQLAAARSQIGGLQAQLHEAEVDAKRLATLVGQRLVSKSQYDQGVARRDALLAQLTTDHWQPRDAAGRENVKSGKDALVTDTPGEWRRPK